MGLSKLTEYTKADFDKLKITPFANPPGVSKTGHPDSKVDIEPKGWVGTDVLAFELVNDVQNNSTINIDSGSEKLDVDVVGDTSASKSSTYWTVKMGAGNGIAAEWTIEYEVSRSKKKTGTWVFAKNKNDDDSASKKPGCLGFLGALLP